MGALRGGTTIGGYLAYHKGNLDVYEKTEMNTLLNGKAPSVHTHTIAQITSLQTELNAKETPAGAQAKANTAETNARNFADTMNSIYSADTRAVNSPPTFYDRRFYMEFKQLTTMGLPAVGGTYCTILTDGRWASTSGGQVSQMAFTDTNRNFYRTSTSSTAWGSWLEYESTTGAQSKVDAHANLKTNPHAVTKAQVGLSLVDNIQQATKAEFNTHNGDATRHITAAERTAWNAKTTSAEVNTLINGKLPTSIERRVAATATGQTTITIGIPYTKTLDTLLVFQEGINLYEGEHFTVNAAGTAIVLNGYSASLGDSFRFLVFKDCKPA